MAITPGRPGTALLWSIGNTALARFGTVAIGIGLARALGPEAFGTYAVALVVLVALLSFNELGVSLAIVRWQDDPAEIAPTVTTLSLAASCITAAITYAGAPLLAGSLGDASATGPVRWMALCVVVSGAVAAPVAVLQRYFHQGIRALADQVNVWSGAIISLALALHGMGAMALVVGRITGTLLSAIILIRWSPLPYRMGFSRQHTRSLLAFGLPLAGASILVFLLSYVDQLVVGAMLGSVALGYYVLAFNLSGWPVTLVSLPLRNVAPAFFARIDSASRERSATFLRLHRLLALVAVPSCIALAVAARPIIQVIYGHAWAPAAPIFAMLAVFAAFKIMFELSYDYLVVSRRSAGILTLQGLSLVVLVPAMVGGVDLFGARGAAVAQAACAAMVIGPLYVVLLRRVGISARRLLAGLVPAGVAGGVIAMTVLPLLTVGLPASAELAVVASLGSGVMATAILLRRHDLRSLRRQLRAAEGPPRPEAATVEAPLGAA